jgi:HEAT repeat protein
MNRDDSAPEGQEERRYRALLELDPRARASLEPLLAALDDASWRVRSAAAERLACAPAELVLPALLSALEPGAGAGRRNAAAAALVGLGAPALRAVVDALVTGGPEVRTAAAEILGEAGDRRVVPALAARLCDRDPNARAAAAEALGKIGGPEAVSALQASLADGDASLRRAAVAALAQLRAPPPARRLVELARDRELRLPVLRLAGASNDPAALSLVVEAVTDPSRSTRETALAVLGQQRLRRTMPLDRATAALQRMGDGAADRAAAALRSDDLAVRAGALVVLRFCGAAGHAEAVAAAAEEEELQALASEALEEMGRAVLPALKAASPRLGAAARAAALGVMARLGGDGVAESLLDGAASEDDRLRGTALEALGRLGDPATVAPLAPLLEHADAAVSGAVVAALARIASRSPRARAAVVTACRSSEREPTPALCRLLGRVGDEDDLPALRAGLCSPDVALRAAASAALGELGGRVPSGRAPALDLLGALEDPEATVRAAAARAIGPLAARLCEGGDELRRCAFRALAAALRDEAPLVRAAAAFALGRCHALEQVPALSRMASDPASPAQAAAAAVHALAEMGAVKPEVLSSAVHHPDPEVVKEAVTAAALASGPAAAELLLAAARHERWDVRRTAARALAVRADRSLTEAVRALAGREDDPLVSETLWEALRALEGEGG